MTEPWQKYLDGAPPPGKKNQPKFSEKIVQSEAGPVFLITEKPWAHPVGDERHPIPITPEEVAIWNDATGGGKVDPEIVRAVAKVKTILGGRIEEARELKGKG